MILKKKKKRAELQSVILSRAHGASCSLSPNLPIFILVFLPPTQEQSVKWLINVHLEEPHGQKKPHVDKNAQSASTDNTVDRSTLGAQKQEQATFEGVNKSLLHVYLKLFTFSLYLNIFLKWREKVFHHRVNYNTRLYEKTTKKVCNALLLFGRWS